jgi:orotidine-5'-phosphate decarboxylase
MQGKDRIIVAVDTGSVDTARDIVDELSPHVGMFKFGLEFIYAMLSSTISARHSDEEAAESLRRLRRMFETVRSQLFWDGKLDDIPNTVAGASLVLSAMDVTMFNVHAGAGPAAVRAAVAGKRDSLVLAVTLLTSLKMNDLPDIGYRDFTRVRDVVQARARMAVEQGVDGIICSAADLMLLNEEGWMTDGVLRVTPGIRPKWAAPNDQARITTPADAIKLGADYLVIGRPLTKPPAEIGSRIKAAQLVAEEIQQAEEEMKA